MHLAFNEIRLAGAGSPQVARRLKAALTDLKSIAPPDRTEILDLQLDLLTTATEASLSDERDVALALNDDREGIGAAAGSLGGKPPVRRNLSAWRSGSDPVAHDTAQPARHSPNARLTRQQWRGPSMVSNRLARNIQAWFAGVSERRL